MIVEEKMHAPLSASTAHRWLVCTPSARLEKELGAEEDCSVYAAEGTAAHALAELKSSLRFKKISNKEFEEKYEAFKTDEETGPYYNADFEEYVDSFVDFVAKCAEEMQPCDTYFETRVDFSNVVPQGFGTADVLIINKDTIHVIDLKFGAGVPVSAIDNPQLRLYAMGALNMFPNTKNIKMTINQPRLDSISTEEIDKTTLLDWAFNFVKPKADEAIEGKGPLVPTESACRFCKLRGKCKARAEKQLMIAKEEFAAPIINENNYRSKAELVRSLSDEEISHILQVGPEFVEFIKDVQAYALGQLVSGASIPGFKLVRGRSNRIITDPERIKKTLLDAGYTEDMIMKPREMLGISGLEKLVGKKLFDELFSDCMIKPEGKLTMAPEDDRRPAVETLAIARSEFAKSIK